MPLVREPLSHYAYVVSDLGGASRWWRDTFGAGPFLLLEDISFDQLDSPDGEAVWQHSAAFGRWGPIAIELQQFDLASPPAVAARLGAGGGVAHVAHVVDDLDATSARLEDAGMPSFLHGVHGEVEFVFHELPVLGHAIEVHRRNPTLEGLFGAVAAAAEGWDGTDPLRPPPGR